MRKITTEIIRSFNDYLINEEKAVATVNKYLHDVGEFQIWLGEQKLCKTAVLAYKSYLCECYASASVNAALSSLNSFFNFMEWYDLRVKNLKIQKIKSGAVFVTRSGNPLDRSNIWSDMKKLCKAANVSEKKVFPHNLRHLFARTYYSLQKDIVRLADILGHSSVNTTRIYTMETGEIHRRQIQKLGLLQC